MSWPAPDHLGDQVEDHHGERRDRRHGADLPLVEPVGGDVGEGEAAQVAQPLGHQEEDDRPADEEGDHVHVAVEALRVGHGGEAEQRGRRHVVAGDGEAVLEAGDAAARGVEVGGGAGAPRGPVGDPHGQRHEHEEHDDGVDVERLLLGRLHGRPGERQRGQGEEGQRGHDAPHRPSSRRLAGAAPRGRGLLHDLGGEAVELPVGAPDVERGEQPEGDEHGEARGDADRERRSAEALADAGRERRPRP